MTTMNKDTQIEKNKIKFMDYYKNDKQFREKHLTYMKVKVQCECGLLTGRQNASRHRTSQLHKDLMILKEAVDLAHQNH